MDIVTHSSSSKTFNPNSKWIPDHWTLKSPGPWFEPPLDLTQNIKRHNFSKKLDTNQKAEAYVDFQETVSQISYSRKQTPYWFVTINPKNSIDFDDFHTICIDIFSQPKIAEAIWSYEVRKENEGLHCHALFHLTKPDKNFAYRNLRKRLVPDICGTAKHVHIKWIDQSDIPKVVSYIKKTNVAKSKKKSDAATKKYRDENDIEDFYILGEGHLLVCPAPEEP